LRDSIWYYSFITLISEIYKQSQIPKNWGTIQGKRLKSWYVKFS